MPKDKDLKKRVRARMEKTGESYTSARAQLVKGRTPREDFAKLAGMSDEAVEAKTGRAWAGWVRVLDDAGATSMKHKEIATLLREQHEVSAWWAQSVTVAYERIRGLRDVGQRRGGGYDANKSKTLPVPVATLYAAFSAAKRRQWLADIELEVSTSSKDKSIRFRGPEDTRVEVYFWEKGPEKSQVQLQQRGLADAAAVERAKAFWGEQMASLAAFLKG